jgi:cation diffusion facilitator CzcD-associated flavoprotein CzcO
VSRPAERHQVLIVGAGAAGLGVAAVLGRRGIAATVLERSDRVGASWRNRYEGLRLNNDRWSARLPRSWMRGAGRWPAREEFIAHLERYAERRGLEIRFGVEVERVERQGSSWRLQTSAGAIDARFVAICAGHDRVARVPEWPGLDRFDGQLLHAAEFRRADAFEGRDVLVVGLGTSATEIATRLVAAGAARVRVAVRGTPNLMPAQFAGLPMPLIARALERAPVGLVDRLARIVQRLKISDLDELGLAEAPYGVATELALKGMGPVIDRGFLDAVRGGRIEPIAALAGLDGAEAVLADGARVRPEVVIAATGYRSGLEQLVGELGVLDEEGEPAAPIGQSDTAPGLYFNGYWLPLSGELSGMRRGARWIARAITAELSA